LWAPPSPQRGDGMGFSIYMKNKLIMLMGWWPKNITFAECAITRSVVFVISVPLLYLIEYLFDRKTAIEFIWIPILISIVAVLFTWKYLADKERKETKEKIKKELQQIERTGIGTVLILCFVKTFVGASLLFMTAYYIMALYHSVSFTYLLFSPFGWLIPIIALIGGILAVIDTYQDINRKRKI
jgi:hypothetical protein